LQHIEIYWNLKSTSAGENSKYAQRPVLHSPVFLRLSCHSCHSNCSSEGKYSGNSGNFNYSRRHRDRGTLISW
jgi:hypothetical protein